MRNLEDRVFLLLVIAVSLAFVWIILPFSGAVLWGTVLAIVFRPLYRLVLRSTRQKQNVAALTTLAIILFIVVLPVITVGVMLVR